MSRDNVGLCFDAAITVQVSFILRWTKLRVSAVLRDRISSSYSVARPLQVVDGTKAVPILGSRGGSSESETSSFSYAGFRENIIQKVGFRMLWFIC